jgi:CRISPR-associated protein Csh1
LLKDCLDIFKDELDIKGDRLLLDEYVLSDGTYVIVTQKEDRFEMLEPINIKFDKKSRELDRSNKYYEKLCFYEYNSYYLESNKAIKDKNIFSNNYLTFFIKKESVYAGKITNDVIDSYFSILENPYLKYPKSKGKSHEAYKSIEKELEPIDIEKIERHKKWIKENIYELAEKYKGKDYLKIFFEADDEEYIREGKRYFISNIYNSADYNKKIKDKIWGLPNNNMGMNAKKPFLENKTRSEKAPYLIDNDEVMVQKKFFDFLLNKANLGRVNIYLSDEEIIANKNGEILERGFNGIFLRIKKGKELEIQGSDIITNYKPNLMKMFNFKNILGDEIEERSREFYSEFKERKKLQEVIDNVLFSKYLINNYFTESKDISIKDDVLKSNLLIGRDAIFNWLYKGYKNGIDKVLSNISMNLIKGSIDKGNFKKAKDQFNLRWSFENYFNGGINMADIVYELQINLRNKINSNDIEKITSDDEFYFATGQLVNYLLYLSKSKNKTQSLVNPFINAKSNEIIKEKLRALYLKYNYVIEQKSKRFNNLYGMILSYNPSGKVNQDMILAGYLKNSLIYEKDNKEDK